MKAVRIHEFGGPEVLKLEDLPEPKPGDGELLIEVRAASVNPVDYKIREGKYPPVQAGQLPVVMGRDVAGVVLRLGPGAAGFKEGDEVYAMLPQDRGGYAEQVAAPAGACACKPESINIVKAASVPLAALTAWQGLFDHGALSQGETVLIHGASGGVGHFAVQFAKAKGAKVAATASGDMKRFVQGLGADQVIDYKAERFEDLVKDVDLVFDLIGGETQDRSWSVLKKGGRLICTVQEPDQAKAAERKITAKRYTAQPNGAQLREIAALIDGGKVRVTLDRVFPLAEAAEAETHLQNDHIKGKVVLKVS